jgi:hypothetical protein
MDRDRHARLDAEDRFGRSRRIEVPGPKTRPPAPYRQEREIDISGEVVHLRAEVRVAREVDTRAPADAVAERLRLRAERPSSPIVLGAYRLDRDPADVDPFTGPHLDDLASGFPHELSESFWHDDLRPAADAAKRRQVQVIVMAVRDEDDIDVDVFEEVRHGVAVPVEQAEPILEQRVGENADAIRLDEDGRVPEVAKMPSHGPSVLRA